MKYGLLFISAIACTLFGPDTNGQIPTWSEDVASIIYDNCTSCHNPAGIGPFSLMSYQDAVDFGQSIKHEVMERRMPPWPADPDYRHFADEAYLTDAEIQTIETWVNFFYPEGDLNHAPSPPAISINGSLMDRIDYTAAIEPYTLQSDVDEYRWFVIPTNFPDTVYVNQIEVIAGLEKIVHHADISYDITGASIALDNMDPLPGFNSSTGSPVYSKYMNAWQPGGNIASYPENWGIMVPPGAAFVIEIHYGPGGIGLTDSTKVHLRFVDDVDEVRAVNVGWLLGQNAPVLLDGPLVIPANQEVSFHQRSAPLTKDISFISICPHMHQLGKSYKVWATLPSGDTIPLIDIPQWDFHWQKYYKFQYVQNLPAGSILHSEGVYDNTIFNHDNPFNPPQTVYQGSSTTDEMFLCYFIYADYQPGDENLLLDSSLLDTPIVSGLNGSLTDFEKVIVFPNPVMDYIEVKNLLRGDELLIKIYNQAGMTIWEQKLNPAIDLNKIYLSELPSGAYILQLVGDDYSGTKKFIKL